MGRGARKRTRPYVKPTAAGIYCVRQGSVTTEGWDGAGGGGRFKREGTSVYLWLILMDVWQKPTYYKAIILQLNINTFFNFKVEKQ